MWSQYVLIDGEWRSTGRISYYKPTNSPTERWELIYDVPYGV